MVHTQQHRPFLQRVMFWGAICSKGPIALSRIDGTMTGPKYIATLNRFLVPFLENQPLSMCYQFQHDNAPCHTAQITKRFLADNSIEVLPNWPPYSPDLNVIENLWAFLKNKVRRESVTTREDLEARVMEIWRSSEVKELCERLVTSMPRRIAGCIANKGGYIKY